MSVTVTIKQLLEAGVHFGHQTRRWNPKMASYIFTQRNGIHIINLEKTLAAFTSACDFLKRIASEGGSILLVGTKKQAQESIKQIAEATGMPFVNERWLGGMLTNFETIRKSIHRLEQIETMEREGTYQFITKKEANQIKKEGEKLNKVLSGIRKIKRLPSAVFIIDPVKEEIAVRESRKLSIPIVALIDTNCDPELINYPIPGNDDALRSIKLIAEVVQKSIQEGLDQFRNISSPTEETKVAGEGDKPSAPEALVVSEDGPAEIVVPAAESGEKEEIAEVVEDEVVSKLEVKEKPRVKKARIKKD
ncbi:MAG: 30S ribosomal protein S2 [Candidatus Omnitrophica bacterium]|nr:30S ribosomal protein S2 [Candidatus Omnitrophota bacterium]